MLAPLLVNDRQDDHALGIAHLLLAANGGHRLFELVVLIIGVLYQGVAKLFSRKLTRGTILGAFHQLLMGNGGAVEGIQRIPQRVQIPVLHVAGGGSAGDISGHGVINHAADIVLNIAGIEDVVTGSVNHLALLVEHLVVLKDVFTHLKVLVLHLRLGALNGVRDHLGFDGDIVRHIEAVHHVLHGLTHEAHHQLIAHGQVEAGLTRVTLAASTTTQLVINAAGLVTLGTQHVEATGLAHLVTQLLGALPLGIDFCFPGLLVLLFILEWIEAALAQLLIEDDLRVTTKHDIGTTAGHIGSHSDGAGAARTGDDLALFLVVLSVEHVVLNAALRQQLGQVLGALHGGGTDQNRLAGLDVLGNIVHYSGELSFLRLVDAVGVIGTLIRLIGRNRHHI